MSALPERYRSIVEPLVEQSRSKLEAGETLPPMAFVGAFESRQIVPVRLQTESEESKDKAVALVRTAVNAIGADFVFIVTEAWSLRKDKLRQVDAIMEKYGSIGASPYAVDIVSLAVETRHGVWMAEVPIRPKGISKKKRTFGPPEFRHFTQYDGRFVNLLPVKDGGTVLH
jgi:hypothetical protein